MVSVLLVSFGGVAAYFRAARSVTGDLEKLRALRS
jgi:hypothetical protein